MLALLAAVAFAGDAALLPGADPSPTLGSAAVGAFGIASAGTVPLAGGYVDASISPIRLLSVRVIAPFAEVGGNPGGVPMLSFTVHAVATEHFALAPFVEGIGVVTANGGGAYLVPGVSLAEHVGRVSFDQEVPVYFAGANMPATVGFRAPLLGEYGVAVRVGPHDSFRAGLDAMAANLGWHHDADRWFASIAVGDELLDQGLVTNVEAGLRF